MFSYTFVMDLVLIRTKIFLNVKFLEIEPSNVKVNEKSTNTVNKSVIFHIYRNHKIVHNYF